jgi:hypothetical protein
VPLKKKTNYPCIFVACQNATILLAGVGGPSDPTIARGNITSLLKHLELARKSTTSHVDATRPPCRHIFRDAHFEIFQFCLFVSSVSSFFVYRFAFEFHFGVTVPAISGRLEQHALAPKFRVEVALRL